MSQGATSRRRFLGGTVAAAAGLALGVGACSPPIAGRISALRVGWTTEPDSMNPLTATTTQATEVQQLIYDTLLEYDVHLRPAPGLALSSEYSPDGREVTYRLRRDVTWHDGVAFTAADVKFSFEMLKRTQVSGNAQYVADLTSVDIPDPHTVVVRFGRPTAFDPGLAIFILPEHIWGGMNAAAINRFANSRPVGTGPYRFDRWDQGQYVTVTANPRWWGDAPHARRITWILFQNEDLMTQSLGTGALDICPEVPPDIWTGLHGQDNVTAVSLPSFSFHHIGFNVSASKQSKGNPLLKDLVIRQALALGFDRQRAVDIALLGRGQPGSSMLPTAFGADHLDVPADRQYDNDPARARETLEAAGYRVGSDGVRRSPSGERLQFRLIAIAETSVDVTAAQLFAQSAAAIGIRLDFSTLDANTLSSVVYTVKDPDWDIFVWGWDSGLADPDYLLSVPLCSQIGDNNDVQYCDPRYDYLYNIQAATIDPARRLALVHEAQQYFYDATAYIIMWYQSKLQAYRNDTWTGWEETPGGIVLNFTRANYLLARPA